jgi:hypothetical protein
MLGSYFTEKALAFTLDVTVTNKPFGDGAAYILIEGQDGYSKASWYNWKSIKTGVTSGTVTLNLPDDSFPIGSIFQVCVSSKQVMNLHTNCYPFHHQNDHEAIYASLT